MFWTLAAGPKPDPMTVMRLIINANGESCSDSGLMVKGNTFAPGAKIGRNLGNEKSKKEKGERFWEQGYSQGQVWVGAGGN